MISSDQIVFQVESLQALCAEGAVRAHRANKPVLVSLTYSVPWRDAFELLHAAQLLGVDRSFWSVPLRGFTLVGIGEAAALEGYGAERFSQVARAWHVLLDDALIQNPTDLPGTGPLLMGGFSFDPKREPEPMWSGFPDARLVLPSLSFTMYDGDLWLTHNLVVNPDESGKERADDHLRRAERLWTTVLPRKAPAEPRLWLFDDDAARWRQQVGSVAHMLGGPDLEKVVLARAVRAASDQLLQPHHALVFLRSAYPDCFLYSFSRGERTFLGATPEQLVRFVDGDIETMCLAGSIRRGATPEEDESLGRTLLQDAKERREHYLVVQAIRTALAGVCEGLNHPDEPTLLKLGNVQHLFTPVRARRRDGHTILDVVERLHPTPAVGGTPREAAMAVIREREDFNRGWYASPVGWLDARGDGEFAVALRCALVERREAVLFAGCGIMPASDPQREYEEATLKMRPMLAALGGTD